MLQPAGRHLVLLVAGASAMALMPAANAAPVAAGETARPGPWEIESVYKNDAFDRCSISRTLDDGMSIAFVRTREDLSMLLASPHWELEPGKTYPVTLKLGPRSWDRDLDAKAGSVSMAVNDAGFASGLRAAGTLHVVAAGETIRVPLDGSTGAFERLEQCVEKGERGVPPPPARPAVEAKAQVIAAEDAVAPSGGESPPPPAAKPAVETEETPAEETIVTSEEEKPPPPVAKPAGAPKVTPEETIVTSEEEKPPPPAAKPAVEAEGTPAEEAAATPQAESPPAAAKPERASDEPVVKKASPKKKRRAQSSTDGAKRAFKREVDRLRRFFGN